MHTFQFPPKCPFRERKRGELWKPPMVSKFESVHQIKESTECATIVCGQETSEMTNYICSVQKSILIGLAQTQLILGLHKVAAKIRKCCMVGTDQPTVLPKAGQGAETERTTAKGNNPEQRKPLRLLCLSQVK